MFDQTVNIININKLYNILNEIDNLFSFNIFNYNNLKKFIKETEIKNNQSKNLMIVNTEENYKILLDNNIHKNNIMLIEKKPIKIELLLDKINTKLIKQKYNLQSNLVIKDYTLDINSRIISKGSEELRLTQREIDILLFLKEQKVPQKVSVLQNKVWRYNLDLETHTVETHIYRLRKKIKNKFNDDKFIINFEEGYSI